MLNYHPILTLFVIFDNSQRSRWNLIGILLHTHTLIVTLRVRIKRTTTTTTEKRFTCQSTNCEVCMSNVNLLVLSHNALRHFNGSVYLCCCATPIKQKQNQQKKKKKKIVVTTIKNRNLVESFHIKRNEMCQIIIPVAPPTYVSLYHQHEKKFKKRNICAKTTTR
jgi:hypothetical protein